MSDQPVLLVCGAFSRYAEALDWTRERVVRAWGPIALESERFIFDQTGYYTAEMGEDLTKTFFAMQRLVDPAGLADLKRQTIRWEQTYSEMAALPEPRPLNVDPGYLTEAKLVLATTKNRDHRIYLRDGIFAEVTLYYRGGQWCDRPWTYPDFRSQPYKQFFERCRRYYREKTRQ